MATRFLSLPLDQLTEPASIALAQQIECADISTPLSQKPIATAFVRRGEGGFPIVLLHGFDSSVFEFRRLLPLLATQQQTWAIDLLGFGFTERHLDNQPAVPFSPTAIKTHLYYTWKTLIGQPVILVGASMGGAAAIDFALTYPEAVHQLVLIDSAGFSAGPAMGKFLVPPLGYLATAFLRNLKVRQNISLKAYHDAALASADALRCAALHLEQTGWQQALIAFTRSGGYGSFAAQLAQIQAPTLILWGEQDRILGTTDAAKFQQAIPNSQLVWISACGHVPHLEKPEETARAMLDFVRGQS
jgi:pimeloyl-ACP methyl ester carboxylesterase